MKTNLALVDFCKQAVDKTGYVYGALGQVCTKDLLDRCAKSYPANNLAGGDMRIMGNKWLGKRVTDCIGLLKYFVMSDGYGKNPVYNQEFDKSANGAFNQSAIKGTINTIPEIPGLCLHMDGHFGVYIGNGDVIEARGTYYGVVKTRLKDRPWTHWFKSPWIKYDTESFKSDTTSDLTIKHGAYYQLKITADKSPTVTAGIADVITILPRYDVGNDHYFYLCAVGAAKSGTGIFVNGKKQFVVNIK